MNHHHHQSQRFCPTTTRQMKHEGIKVPTLYRAGDSLWDAMDMEIGSVPDRMWNSPKRYALCIHAHPSIHWYSSDLGSWGRNNRRDTFPAGFPVGAGCCTETTRRRVCIATCWVNKCMEITGVTYRGCGWTTCNRSSELILWPNFVSIYPWWTVLLDTWESVALWFLTWSFRELLAKKNLCEDHCWRISWTQ